jgi:hypothetical protein
MNKKLVKAIFGLILLVVYLSIKAGLIFAVSLKAIYVFFDIQVLNYGFSLFIGAVSCLCALLMIFPFENKVMVFFNKKINL